MFEATGQPRLFGLPPGADFPAALVQGMEARMKGAPPEAMARVTIIVNTQRMGRRLTDLFAARSGTLLPRILPLTRIPTAFPTPGLPPPRDALRRRLELARLIGALLDQDPDLAPRASVYALADSLAALFDEMQGEGVDATALQSLDVDDISGHWARSLRFIEIVQRFVTDRADGAADPEARQRRAVEALLASWDAAPPAEPVIVAGSTGSRATTALLMEGVARLPQGAVVLPGFDFEMPDDTWRSLGNGRTAEDHPQSRFAALLSRMDLAPADVAPWVGVRPSNARNSLVSLALRPAPVTDQWLRDGPDLGDLRVATARLSLIEAPTRRIEAQAIALRLRQAVEDGVSAALVTPDRTLTRQVAAALARWGIEPDDSAGRPLALSAPGRFLRQTAGLLGIRLEALALIAVLKHPLAHSTRSDRGEHLLNTRELELELRRRALVFPTRAALQAWADKGSPARRAWLDWVFETLEPVARIGPGSLDHLVSAHLALAERLAAGAGTSGSGELWEKQAGVAAWAAMDALTRAADAVEDIAPGEYPALLMSVLSGAEVRDPVLPHPGVMIWGTLEARVQGADLVIVAGLNDGVWPEIPAPDPWLNRRMRRDAGLLLPERRVGLSAHDFQQAIAAPEVVITRALRDSEAETVPSRWLNRLLNLMAGLPDQNGPEACAEMRARGRIWLDMARAIDHRLPAVPSELRPSPAPPPGMRPKRLSVTEIQTLIRDPYAIYARHVLGLRELDPLDRQPDAALRGSALHAVIETFMRADPDPTSADAGSRLMAVAEEVLTRTVPWPATARLWLARFGSVVPGLLEAETARRAAGTPYPPERWGTWTPGPVPFELVGKADRIDRLNDGQLAIYDYKSGSVPSPDQMRHFDKQLLLEAVMAEAGGFKDVPVAPVARVGYIALGASASDRDVACEDTGKDDFRTETIASEFRRLIAAYAEAGRGYSARRAVQSTRFEGRYDQLARFGEWDESDDPVTVDLS